jgi:hypothetical protein
VALNHRTHGAIENDEALLQQRQKGPRSYR